MSVYSRSVCRKHENKMYRVIHKSLRDFQPLQYSSRDGHSKGEHVNRGRDTPSFRPTLQVLDMSTLGDAADVNPVIKFSPHTLHGYCTAEVGNPGGDSRMNYPVVLCQRYYIQL